MSELAVATLRLGLLAALWVLIIAIVASQGRDLMVGRRNKVRGQKKQLRAQDAEAAAVAAQFMNQQQASPSAQAQQPAQAQPKQPVRSLPTQLAIVEGPLAGRVVDLHGAPLMIGRAQECDLILDDDYVSGRHARLFPQGTRWFLEDLGSTNGTYVNGAQLARTLAVEPGSSIRIGKTVLELRQ